MIAAGSAKEGATAPAYLISCLVAESDVGWGASVGCPDDTPRQWQWMECYCPCVVGEPVASGRFAGKRIVVSHLRSSIGFLLYSAGVPKV